jgi:hypothetical protein
MEKHIIKGQNQSSYRDELTSLFIKEGIPAVNAKSFSNVLNSSQYKEAIRFQKLRLKELNIEIN